MKALIRWGAVLSVAGSTLLAPSLAGRMAAIAIPEAQVIERLSNVPLFMITNQQGVPLSQTLPSPQDKSKQVQVFTFFVSQTDAQSALTGLKSNQPDLGKQAKVSPVALGNVVKMALDSQKQKTNVVTNILPSQQQLQSAVTLLKQSGELVDKNGQLVTKEGKPFPGGTPLFYGADKKTGGLLSIEGTFKENGQDKKISFVPFYMNKQDLQTNLDQAKKDNPQLASTAKIEVVMLDALLSTLLSSNDPAVNQFQIVPSRDALEFVIQQQPQGTQGAPQPAASPQARPKKK